MWGQPASAVQRQLLKQIVRGQGRYCTKPVALIVIAALCVISLRRAARGGAVSDNSTLYRAGDHAGGGGRLLGLRD